MWREHDGLNVEIVDGRRGIGADTALRPAPFFDMSPDPWIGLQSDDDRRLAPRRAGTAIAERVQSGYIR